MIGAAASLMVNVLGALLAGRHPLDLIRVYLTFPMGEAALTEERGKVLFVGCVLYLTTGGLFGIVFHLMMRWCFTDAPPRKRFIAATAMGLGLWVVNFYLVLSWLQPVLLGGSWIITEMPFYIAAGTHLVFAADWPRRCQRSRSSLRSSALTIMTPAPVRRAARAGPPGAGKL